MNARLSRPLTLLVVLVAVASGAVAAGASSHTVERISGTDRYATSVEISKRLAPTGADLVSIVTGENWPDALACTTIASYAGGPILLTRRDSIPSVVAGEIARLDGQKDVAVMIFGGPAAVSPSVETQLASLGASNIVRTAGANRYETAQVIAELLDELSGYTVDTAYFATGEDFPDALAAGPIAGPTHRPILLVKRGSIPPETQAAIANIGITKSIVLGGEAAVSPAVMSALPAPTRIAGVDRYDSARLVAEHALVSGATDDMSYVARGDGFADALGVGPLASWNGTPGEPPRPLLLTRPNALPQTTRSYFATHGSNITNLFIIGGPAAVDESVVDAIEDEIP